MKNNKTKLPRVGIVCSPWMGGSGILATELGMDLKKRGYFVKFITFERPYRSIRSGVAFEKVSKLSYALFPDPLYQLPLTEALVKEVKKNKIDIIHCHYALPFSLAALDAKNILDSTGKKVLVVTTLHGSDVIKLGPQVKEVMKYILEKSDIVTAVSQDLARQTKNIYKFKGKIEVIPNFIDIKRYPFVKKRITHQKTIVHMSNFRGIKRIDHIIKTFKEIHQRDPNTKLVLVGDGPMLGHAKSLTHLNGLTSSVTNMGRVKNPIPYLKKADLILTTSEYESFCLANLEAMACGVPAASYNVGGISEVTTHNKDGVLAQSGNYKQLAKMSSELLNSDEYLSRRKEARLKAEKYDVDKVIPLYEEVYKNLLA